MRAIAGTDPAMWRDRVSFFLPGTPMVSDIGMANLSSNLDAAKRLLASSGYASPPGVPGGFPQFYSVKRS